MQEFVGECEVCQVTKYPMIKPQGLLQPLLIPTRPWSNVTMDFIVQLPKSEECMMMLVVVDRFTKVAHFATFPPGFAMKGVA